MGIIGYWDWCYRFLSFSSAAGQLGLLFFCGVVFLPSPSASTDFQLLSIGAQRTVGDSSFQDPSWESVWWSSGEPIWHMALSINVRRPQVIRSSVAAWSFCNERCFPGPFSPYISHLFPFGSSLCFSVPSARKSWYPPWLYLFVLSHSPVVVSLFLVISLKCYDMSVVLFGVAFICLFWASFSISFPTCIYDWLTRYYFLYIPHITTWQLYQ